MQNYLEHLNEAQRNAVINTKGPAMVIAGAGSGKTRVLTYRITHLLAQGVPPYKILALTFTNKAAREMKERIAENIGKSKAASLWMGTFHSVFAKILRFEAEKIGYPSNYTIYDSADSKSLIRTIIKELNLDKKVYKESLVLGKISNAKNNLITPKRYANNHKELSYDAKAKVPEIHRIYALYTRRCKQSGAMDFDDLLLNTNILFRDFPEVLDKYQKRFSYILVDEYQDTNSSQYLIVKKLAEVHKNICVVGDDAQSIYAFRGAKIENIFNFRKDYKNFKLFKLEQNYRSTQNIVEAANSVIRKNEDRIEKNVFSENETGNKIRLIESLTDSEEGYTISSLIFDSVYQSETRYKDHAVLYRTNMQSRIFEEAMRRRNIPYKIYGGTSFYQRKEIKDTLAYFKLSVNHKDNESLKRIINYPKRGIGQTTLERLGQYASSNNISIWETIGKLPETEIKLNSRARNKVLGFAEMISNFNEQMNTLDAYDAARKIASESGILQDLYKDKTPESVVRHENVQELLNAVKDFSAQYADDENAHLSEFLESVSLLTDQDNEDEEDINKVTLMTIHSSKGLEFKNVYIVGTEEKLFPSERSVFSQKGLEEERRLFYVALTRAEKQLTISFARQRYRWGSLYDCVPSRFISEIAPEFLEDGSSSSEEDAYNQNNAFYEDSYGGYKNNKQNMINRLKRAKEKQNKIPKEQIKLMKSRKSKSSKGKTSLNGLNIGDTVEHLRFGKGEIKSLEGEMPNAKATVQFHTAGTKTLLLKFAKLKKL